jgi:pimeloyl-ACP methyl ester carboxylesterase
MTGLASHQLVGQGPDLVLLLHGIGGGQAMWGETGSATLQALADAGLRALALDFPGYGGSAGLQPVSLASMVDAVVALLRIHAQRRVALVGHSMGGMVAQELLATQPDVPVHALVLACTSPAFGSPQGDWQARFVADRLAPLDAGLGMIGMAERLVPTMVSTQAVAEAQPRAMAVMARVPEATYRAALTSIVAFDRRAALPAIAVPTLCLAGEHDKTAPPEVMQRMAGKIPGARYQCLNGAGHIANVEQPDAFNAALVSFLKAHGFGS